MTGVFLTLENAQSFDLKQFFLQDSVSSDQSQSIIYDQISPLAFLFLIKALRPDLLQTFCNDFPANIPLLPVKSLEATLLQNSEFSIAVLNNSELPRLQEALQLLLQFSKVKITTFLPKNYNQDAFVSAINLLRCIFLQETLPAAKVAEAVDIISSILNKEKKPAKVVTFINQKHQSGNLSINLHSYLSQSIRNLPKIIPNKAIFCRPSQFNQGVYDFVIPSRNLPVILETSRLCPIRAN